MRIVHINATDNRGGAAIACARHNEAMAKAGLQSEVVTLNDYQGLFRVLKSFNYRVNSRRENRLKAVANFSLMDFGIPIYKNTKVQLADVIFLHWICGNTLSINGVEKILKLGKPTFWYMHDMFPFTGGCHYALSCDGYTRHCNECPQITNSICKNEASRQLGEKIKKWNGYPNLEFISPSRWEASCAITSALCKGHKIHTVANILDTDTYKHIDIDAKRQYGLDPKKKTILFGATRISSPYKGANFAAECLNMLDPNRYEGLVIGRADADFISNLSIHVVQTGFLTEDKLIAAAYNACDTFIMTSIAESFGQVVLEAMSCGKPCVGFPTGGVVDLIRHNKSGYLTQGYDASELKAGIEWLFSDKERYNRLSHAARRQILNENSFAKVLEIHSELKPYL